MYVMSTWINFYRRFPRLIGIELTLLEPLLFNSNEPPVHAAWSIYLTVYEIYLRRLRVDSARIRIIGVNILSLEEIKMIPPK